MLDLKDAEPIKLDQDIEENNIIFRYTLEAISETELAKLIQVVEDITAKFGLLNTAKALLDAQAEDTKLQKINLFQEDLVDRKSVV